MFRDVLEEEIMKLAAMARKVQTLKKRANVDPLVYFRPTLPQKQFIEDTSKLKILLGGAGPRFDE